MRVTGYCRGGFFPALDAKGRTAPSTTTSALDEAAAIGAECLVLVVGGLPVGTRDISGARNMVAEGIDARRAHARSVGVPLGIEPLHPMYAADRAYVNTLGQALDMCEALGDDVVIDVYHLWWDPDFERQIARAGYVLKAPDLITQQYLRGVQATRARSSKIDGLRSREPDATSPRERANYSFRQRLRAVISVAPTLPSRRKIFAAVFNRRILP